MVVPYDLAACREHHVHDLARRAACPYVCFVQPERADLWTATVSPVHRARLCCPVAHGLSRFPIAIRWPLVGAALWLSLSLLHNYHPVPKADWRTFAIWLRAEDKTSGAGNSLAEPGTIVVHPTDNRFNREEVEAAPLFTFSPPWRVVLFDRKRDANYEEMARRIYDVYCSAVPSRDDVERHDPTERRFQGIRVIKRNSARPPNESRGDRT